MMDLKQVGREEGREGRREEGREGGRGEGIANRRGRDEAAGLDLIRK